jgi:hemolysin activation/secretion protein
MAKKQKKLLSFVLLALSQGAFAQQAPSAGSQIQQIPQPLAPQKAPPQIRIEPVPAIPAGTLPSDQTRMLIKSLQIKDAQAYSEAELLSIAGFQAESELTLSDLYGMASKISGHYHQNGYFLAQAYLPAQDIEDGVVKIAVIEGRYGKVTVQNQTNLSDSVVASQVEGLKSGDAVTINSLENRLLLLSDIPGVNVRSTLVPGASVGTSDLIVEVTTGQRVTGGIDADNHGNRYTGQNRIGATVNLNNPSGHGDVASLRILTSGSGLNYGRAFYQAQLGKAKTGIAYASMNYALGREFESLQAKGSVRIASLYASYPLIRSRSNNLNVQLAFDAKTFQDKQDATATVTDKKAQVWMASLNGDQHDGFHGGGMSSYSLTWTAGNLDLQTLAARVADAASASSNGHYGKLGFNAMRLQSVSDATTLYAAISGQFASKNLDISEKMELGGANAVRAYPEGEAYADQGYVLTVEARRLLPKLFEQQPGQMQLIGFIDTGSVRLNKTPWPSAAAQNSRTLSGAGIGINWVDNANFVVKAYYAHKLGSAAATSAPDAKGRFWIQAVKYF